MTDLSYLHQRHLGLLRATGADARRFLHAQTTQDILGLGPEQTALAAWLSAKGRVRALFDVVPDGDAGFWLVTPADNLDWLQSELGRFVLRADVELERLEASAVYSLIGPAQEWLESNNIESAQGRVTKLDDLRLIRVAPDRIDAIGDSDALARACAGLASAKPDDATRSAIAAGRPEIAASQREHYTAQMLNLDLLGAVSFTKGCYPGQEIVARTQNLGQAKRRLRRFSLMGPRPVIGSAVVDGDGREVGEVNLAAAVADHFELLAVAPLMRPDESLSLARGVELEAMPLPYEPPPAD